MKTKSQKISQWRTDDIMIDHIWMLKEKKNTSDLVNKKTNRKKKLWVRWITDRQTENHNIQNRILYTYVR